MARPRTVSDDDILSSTRLTCVELGARCSVDQIADKLGISAPAILKRFGSKDALLIKALSPPEDPSWAHEIERGPDSRPLRAQLEDMFDTISTFFSEVMPCVSVLRESGIDVHQISAIQKAPLRGLQALREWLSQASDRGLVQIENVETAATAILGSIQFHSFLSHVVRKSVSENSRVEYNRSLAKLYTLALAPSDPKKAKQKTAKKNKPRAQAALKSTSRRSRS